MSCRLWTPPAGSDYHCRWVRSGGGGEEREGERGRKREREREKEREREVDIQPALNK